MTKRMTFGLCAVIFAGCAVAACEPDKPRSQAIAELCAETYSAPDDVDSCKLREAMRYVYAGEQAKEAAADHAADGLR